MAAKSAERIFKRKIYERMLEWKKNQHGTTALLIRGARRVGKSTVVEQFAKHEYENYLIIDFANAPKAVMRLFEDTSDLDFLFTQLQLIYNVTLVPGKSVVVLDEIQKQPLARQAIKYLVKDGRYDYIETGSLLSSGGPWAIQQLSRFLNQCSRSVSLWEMPSTGS